MLALLPLVMAIVIGGGGVTNAVDLKHVLQKGSSKPVYYFYENQEAKSAEDCAEMAQNASQIFAGSFRRNQGFLRVRKSNRPFQTEFIVYFFHIYISFPVHSRRHERADLL